MQVVVATDAIGVLSSARAGRIVATGWSHDHPTVLPVGEAGAGFVQAYADQHGLALTAEADAVLVESARCPERAVIGVSGAAGGPGIAYERSSWPLGAAVRRLLQGGAAPRELVLDLTGTSAHDGGAGLLAALGATADRQLDSGVEALDGIGRLELEAVRFLLAGIDLVGVVPSGEASAGLLGLRGITSLRGREVETDPAVLLRTDASLQRLAGLLAPGLGQRPGAGACGGLGLAVLALGGRLATGPGLAWAGLPAAPVDLVVTGCTVFDFLRRGGGVVAAAADRAAALLSPCVLLAGAVVVGSREMRTMGIDAAYALGELDPAQPEVVVGEPGLTDLAARVARSWHW